MAKKYLLYIHDELFEKEQNKSQLVNNLLERHYHDTVGGKSQREIRSDIERKVPRLSPKTLAESIPDVTLASEIKCPGHALRMNCGREGCVY